MRREGKIRVRFFGMMLLSLVSLVCIAIDTSQAMKIMPGLEQVGTIKMDRSVLRGPDRLAVGPGGTLYVVDGLKNQILKFDSKGHYLGTIPFMQVSAVGAAADGALYIGSHKDYSVAIYKEGKVVGSLGAGEREFSSVRDIAVCQDTGDIYVVDNIAHVVKIYTASGQGRGVIEGLNLPIGIAIVDKEIYVVDAPATADDMDRKSTGARISVFGPSGELLRSFSETLTTNEGMFRPSGITVDNKGIVYVSDTLQNAVFAYDKTGKLIGSISGEAGEIKGAAALTFSGEGILYLASGEKSEIQMFALSGKATTPEPQDKDKTAVQEPLPIIISISNPPTTPDPDPKGVVQIKSSIVVTADTGSHDTVKIFSSGGKAENEFIPFSKYAGGLDTAVADLDGDGTNEILVGSMDGQSLVGIFSKSGEPRYTFTAFDDSSGALVRAADLDGDGTAEILVAGKGGTGVRIFSYTGSGVIDTGISLLAGAESVGATRIAAGDIDGDGSPELVTATRAGGEQVIQTYKVTTTDGSGKWKTAVQGEKRLPDEANEITELTVADINGDGVNKIVLARNNGDVSILSSDGSRVDRHLSSQGISGMGQLSEGRGNIVTGLSDGTVHIVAPDGTEVRGFSSFITNAGVRVSSGNLGN